MSQEIAGTRKTGSKTNMEKEKANLRINIKTTIGKAAKLSRIRKEKEIRIMKSEVQPVIRKGHKQ